MDQQIASAESPFSNHSHLHNGIIFCGVAFLIGLVVFVHFLVHFRS